MESVVTRGAMVSGDIAHNASYKSMAMLLVRELLTQADFFTLSLTREPICR
jgi:hypothetical protein